MLEQKKNSPPPCIPVSIFLYSRDTFWATRWIFNAPLWFVGKTRKREKREEEKFLSSSLCRLYSLSLWRTHSLLGDRSEIADDDDAVEEWEYSSFARALARKNIVFSEKKKKKTLRGENSNARFFLSRDARRERRRQKTKNKEIKRDFKPHRKRREPLLFFFCYSY